MHYTSAESPSTEGLFAVVRVAFGMGTVECDGFGTRKTADRIAADLNADYQRREAASLAAAGVPPAERRLVKGFYTDDMP